MSRLSMKLSPSLPATDDVNDVIYSNDSQQLTVSSSIMLQTVGTVALLMLHFVMLQTNGLYIRRRSLVYSNDSQLTVSTVALSLLHFVMHHSISDPCYKAIDTGCLL